MICIVGRGNVASHLNLALKDKMEVRIVNPHTLEGFPLEAEIVLICVADKAIKEVIKKLPALKKSTVLAHTAGSVPMNVLKGKSENIGVFYPLQTFTKGVELDYSDIPFFIEGNNNYSFEKLSSLASCISRNVREANSEQRKKLHLASVIACNFSNELASISNNILKDCGMEFKMLLPLMKQMVKKLESVSPEEAQTGPACRGDIEVIDMHLKMLENYPAYQNLYKNLSYMINPDLGIN